MNRRIFSLLAFTFAIILSSIPARAADSYRLRCRGGGDQQVQLFAGPYESSLIMTFARSVWGKFLEPGQCMWDDRAVGPDEPTRICQRQSAGSFQISFVVAHNGSGLTIPASANVAWVQKIHSPAFYQFFHVFNNTAAKCLDVTKVD
jgi:hypothetical protein